MHCCSILKASTITFGVLICIFMLFSTLGQKGLSAIALNTSNHDVIFSSEEMSLTHINTETFQRNYDPIFVGYFVTSLSWQPSTYNQYSKDELKLAAACSDGSLILFNPNRVRQNSSMKGKKKMSGTQRECRKTP